MKRGYIKLWRKIKDDPWMKKPAYLSVWLHLLIEAEHGMTKEKGKWRKKRTDELRTILWKGKEMKLKAGQLTCGAYQLSEWTGVPRGTVERILKRFKSEEQIEIETSNRCSLITVKKWKQYQMSEEVNEELMRNKRGTDEEQMRTPKECKNVKNDKNENIIAPSNDDADQINQVFKIFYETINPTINYGNKTSRKAAKDLIKQFGLQKTLDMARVACELHGEPYAPTITTPYQLKDKLSQLVAFYKKQQNQNSNKGIQSL